MRLVIDYKWIKLRRMITIPTLKRLATLLLPASCCPPPRLFLLVFHHPPDPLATTPLPHDETFTLLTHRNPLDKSILAIVQTHLAERGKARREKSIPSWVYAMGVPDIDVPDSFTRPVCVMQAAADPLTALLL